MSKVIADISMSLDGYVTAPGADQEHGLGIGGEAIHKMMHETINLETLLAVERRTVEK